MWQHYRDEPNDNLVNSESFKMLLINCKNNLILIWSENFVIFSGAEQTKLYIPIMTLSTQSYAKLLEQLRCAFKRTINWNKKSIKSFNRKKKISI